jgi:hypothetical protein
MKTRWLILPACFALITGWALLGPPALPGIPENMTGKSPQYSMLRLGDFIVGKAPNQNIYLYDEDTDLVPRSTIVNVGEFIEKFFTRTIPMPIWCTALQNARYTEETALLNQRLYQTLR